MHVQHKLRPIKSSRNHSNSSSKIIFFRVFLVALDMNDKNSKKAWFELERDFE